MSAATSNYGSTTSPSAAAGAAAPSVIASRDVEIEVSQNGSTPSSPVMGVPDTSSKLVNPRMTRLDDEPRLLGGLGLSFVQGIPLMTDDNFCRTRCCCMEHGCTELKAEIQYFCLKMESGGNCRVENGIPLKSKHNFCRCKCFCVESGCTVFEMVWQCFCLKLQ